MLAQGWQPYSINVGGKWYRLRRLDPFASLLGPVADFVELSKQIPSTDRDKLGAAVVTALASNLINKTYLPRMGNGPFAARNGRRCRFRQEAAAVTGTATFSTTHGPNRYSEARNRSSSGDRGVARL